MSDPWKDAWEHLKKFLTDRIEQRRRWNGATKDFEQVACWLIDKEQEMVEDGLIEGSETDAEKL